MKKALKGIISEERNLYIPHIKTFKNKIAARYTHIEEYEIFKFICALRKAEFYNNKVLKTITLEKATF